MIKKFCDYCQKELPFDEEPTTIPVIRGNMEDLEMRNQDVCYECLWKLTNARMSWQGKYSIAPNKLDYRIGEVIYDMSQTAQMMLSDGMIGCTDSREMYGNIFAWANEFESKMQSGEIPEDEYLREVDDYVTARLLLTYGNPDRVIEQQKS